MTDAGPDRQLFLALNFDGGPTWDRVMLTLSGTTMWIYVLILWLVWRQADGGMVWFLGADLWRGRGLAD